MGVKDEALNGAMKVIERNSDAIRNFIECVRENFDFGAVGDVPDAIDECEKLLNDNDESLRHLEFSTWQDELPVTSS